MSEMRQFVLLLGNRAGSPYAEFIPKFQRVSVLGCFGMGYARSVRECIRRSMNVLLIPFLIFLWSVAARVLDSGKESMRVYVHRIREAVTVIKAIL